LKTKPLIVLCLISSLALQPSPNAQNSIPNSYTGTFEYRQEFAGSDTDGTKLRAYMKLITGTVTFTKTGVDRTGDFEQVLYAKVSWTMTQAPYTIATESNGSSFECTYPSVNSKFSGMESHGLRVNARNKQYSFSFGQGNKPQPSGTPTCNYEGGSKSIKHEMADLRELDQVISNLKVLAGKTVTSYGPFTTTKTWSFKAQ
jgi:hypothetical protein